MNSPSCDIFYWYPSRSEQKQFERVKKLSVKMKYIVNKMFDERTKALFGPDVLLAAYLAITTGDCSSAVQAVLFLSFWLVGQVKFFLKIGTIRGVGRYGKNAFLSFTGRQHTRCLLNDL